LKASCSAATDRRPIGRNEPPDGTQPGPQSDAAGQFPKPAAVSEGVLDFSGPRRRAEFSPYRAPHRIPLQRCAGTAQGPRTRPVFPNEPIRAHRSRTSRRKGCAQAPRASRSGLVSSSTIFRFPAVILRCDRSGAEVTIGVKGPQRGRTASPEARSVRPAKQNEGPDLSVCWCWPSFRSSPGRHQDW